MRLGGSSDSQSEQLSSMRLEFALERYERRDHIGAVSLDYEWDTTLTCHVSKGVIRIRLYEERAPGRRLPSASIHRHVLRAHARNTAIDAAPRSACLRWAARHLEK